MKELKGKYGNAKIFTDDVDENCVEQIQDMIDAPAINGKVRIMPDCHRGKGSVIGFTMPIKDKVVPNTIGVDIGCFTGDTKVALADGRDLTFEELIEEDKQGKENFCFSVDKNKNIVISKIIKPRKTRNVDKLIEITLDNNKIIQCTTDHIFYDRENKEVKAENLIVGKSLMPLYLSSSSKIDKKLLSYKFSNNIPLNDYAVTYNPNTNLYDYVHHLSDDYNIKHNQKYIIKNKTIRHHIDFHKHNNNPTNICRVEYAEHWKIHADNAAHTNKLGISGFKKAREMHPEFFAKMGSSNMTKLHKNKKFAERRDTRAVENWKKYNKSDKAKEEHKKAGIRGRKYLIEFNKNPKPYTCTKCGRIIKGKGNFNKHIKVCKNHKVVKIRKLNISNEDVFCLTINKYHNFALAAGVFVHNCGVMACKVEMDVKLKMEIIDKFIREVVPLGFNYNNYSSLNDKEINDKFYEIETLFGGENRLASLLYKIGLSKRKAVSQLGSLGGGNHFIEIAKSKNDNSVWVIVHTGSRNVGKRTCGYWQNKANEKWLEKKDVIMKSITEYSDKDKIQDAINKFKQSEEYLMKKELRYLSGVDKEGYLDDMRIAQKFADVNRRFIIENICAKLNWKIVDKVHSVHNYIDRNNIIRKGAIRASKGLKVIIPFNMRDGSIIGVGKGNEEWNMSAPHGAGRLMSRTKAKQEIKLEDFQDTMKNVWSSSVNSDTLDEAPFAYKDKSVIESKLGETVEVEDYLIPVYNLKESNFAGKYHKLNNNEELEL